MSFFSHSQLFQCSYPQLCDFRTIYAVVNTSAGTVSTPPEDLYNLLEEFQKNIVDLNTFIQQFSLFNYPTDAPKKYVQDFKTRMAHDLIRNKGEFERLVNMERSIYLFLRENS